MMATKIYDSITVKTIEDKEIYVSPLKIRYLRDFLEIFNNIKKAKNDDESIDILVQCVAITMKQYCPEIKLVNDVEDNFDLKTIYKILEIAAGITINESNKQETVQEQAIESGTTWDTLDLAKLESEVFLLGIWKDYEELETSLSMPELSLTLEAKRQDDYEKKKFAAALKGIDLDKENGKSDGDAWEKMKAKVFSGNKTTNPNDIVTLQGYQAQRAGFGIGMGLDYEDLTKK